MTPVDEADRLLMNLPVLFERDTRFYYLAWQPTLLDAGAIVRIYGRKGVWQRVLITPYPAFFAARSHLRRIVLRRLNHGYHIRSIE